MLDKERLMAKILIACEFSGKVRDTFAALGHDVMSCDLEATETEGKHYQGDVRDIINDGWDLMIAHPPCTYLTVTGNKWFADQPPRKSGALVGAERRAAREDAINFFMLLANAPIKHIAIENPIGVMSSVWRKPDQVIHPWQFGHQASKSTCLWLKNLPLLIPTDIVDKGEFVEFKSGKRVSKWYADAAKYDAKTRERIRNRTFQGIADAMADQWGKIL